MLTIKCTESEKRKLCNGEANIMCSICYALGACKEFAGHCSKCRKHRSKYVQWNIVKSKPKKAKVKESAKSKDPRGCPNCYYSSDIRGSKIAPGHCRCKESEFYLRDIHDVMLKQNFCEQYSAYEGDG